MLALVVQGGMDVAVHGHGHRGVAQQLAEGFYVEAKLHAAGGKGMAQGMVIRTGQAAFLHAAAEMVLHDPGFDVDLLPSGKKKSPVFTGERFN